MKTSDQINEITQQEFDDFQGMSDQEKFAYQTFNEFYVIKNPEPVLENPKLDWQFYTALITSISAIIGASFRTGQAFYLAAVAKLNPILSFTEALVFIFAIEGGIVMFALQDARNKKKSTDDTNRYALWVAFGISVLAGLYQSVEILGLGADNVLIRLLNGSLVLAMGLGATVIAFLGGDVLGVQMVKLENERTNASERFANSVRTYKGKRLKEWRSSPEFATINERKNVRYKGERTNATNERKPVRSPRTNGANGGGVREEIWAALDAYYLENEALPRVVDMARMVSGARYGTPDRYEELKGYVSEVMKNWREENLQRPEPAENEITNQEQE